MLHLNLNWLENGTALFKVAYKMKFNSRLSLAWAVPVTLACFFVFAEASVAQLPSLAKDAIALYEGEIRTTVDQPYFAGIKALRGRYVKVLDDSMQSAAKQGKLDDAIALKEERAIIDAGKDVPEEDDAKTGVDLKRLRAIWRQEKSRLEKEREAKLKPVVQRYDSILRKIEEDLTRGLKLDDAKAVKEARENLGNVKPLEVIATTTPPTGDKQTPDKNANADFHPIERKLLGSKWTYARDGIPEGKQYVELKQNNQLVEGWSSGGASKTTWHVVGERTVELRHMYSNDSLVDVMVFDPTFRTATIAMPGRGDKPSKKMYR
jgi:hypothetical protein